MRGIYLNDIPVDLLLKYLSDQDLKSRNLSPKLSPIVRDYYEYSFEFSGDEYTMFSDLRLPEDEASLLDLAARVISDKEPSASPEDIESLELVSETPSTGRLYSVGDALTPFSSIMPYRYRFVSVPSSSINWFASVSGSISSDISSLSGVDISDSRDGTLLVESGSLSPLASQSGYSVFTGSTLRGFIVENTSIPYQEVDDLGRPLFIDESGNDTTQPFRPSKIARHSAAIKNAFFSARSENLSDPRQAAIGKLLPGVIGFYKRGPERELFYYEKIKRSFQYERVQLTGSESFVETRIAPYLVSGMPDVGDTFSEESPDYKFNTVLNLISTKRISAKFFNQSTFVMEAAKQPLASQEPVFVDVFSESVSYKGASYPVTMVTGQRRITVGSDSLLVTRNSTDEFDALRLPVKREVDPNYSRYYSKSNPLSVNGTLFSYNVNSASWSGESVRENIIAVNKASEVRFVVYGIGLTVIFSASIFSGGRSVKELSAGDLVIATGDTGETAVIYQVNNGKTAMVDVTASIPLSGGRLFVRSDLAYNGAQSDRLYQRGTIDAGRTTIMRIRPSIPLSKPSDSLLFKRFVTIGSDKKYVARSGDREYVSEGTTNYNIVRSSSGETVYSLGYIEYRVSVERSNLGISYFGQVVSGSVLSSDPMRFSIQKYVPAPTAVNIPLSSQYDVSGWTLSGSSFSRTYYLRDSFDRGFSVKVVETISKDPSNAANGTGTPRRSEFLDFSHTYTANSQPSFQLPSSRTVYRMSSVSGPQLETTFESRFIDFDHQLNDGSLALSTRGDYVPPDTISGMRSRAFRDMAAEFLDRQRTVFFTVDNMDSDENSPMKMRIYAESLEAIINGTPQGSGSISSTRPLLGASSLNTRIVLQSALENEIESVASKPFVRPQNYFDEEENSARSEVTNLSSVDRLLSYRLYPTNNDRYFVELERGKREKIMSESDYSEDARDEILLYDRNPVSRSVSASDFVRPIRRLISDMFYSGGNPESDPYVESFYKYYKEKLSSLDVPEEGDAGERTPIVRTVLRPLVVSDRSSLISELISRVLSRQEKWRVL
jgi:hypothetical protein